MKIKIKKKKKWLLEIALNILVNTSRVFTHYYYASIEINQRLFKKKAFLHVTFLVVDFISSVHSISLLLPKLGSWKIQQ